jgi:hypothetical protein
MGCPGIGKCGTVFVNGFTPTSATWLISTENNANATTYLMDITTNTTNVNFMGSLHWMAGSNSVIRTIHLDKGWMDYERNIIRLYFSDNGGGRVFNYQDEKGNGGTTAYYNSGHRKVKISGTSQQLTFYGLNLERGGSLHAVSAWPMLEIVNSSKVRIFGAKTEASQPYATINGCTDIFMTNIHDYCATGYGMAGANQIEISGTNDNIELSNLVWIGPPAASWTLVSDPWNTNEPSRQNHIGVYHYNWSSIDSDSPTGVDDEQSSSTRNWTIFPNPTNDIFYINSKSVLHSGAKGYVYNSAGELATTFIAIGNESTEINLTEFACGIYCVVIQSTERHKECVKIIKN